MLHTLLAARSPLADRRRRMAAATAVLHQRLGAAFVGVFLVLASGYLIDIVELELRVELPSSLGVFLYGRVQLVRSSRR